VIWEYRGTEIKLIYKAGFIGSVQDTKTGDIMPQISWAVIHREEDEVSKE